MRTLKNTLGIGTIILALASCGKSKPNKLSYSTPLEFSEGIDMVMRGRRSDEIISDKGLKRLSEWNRRLYHFHRCDRNGDGALDGEEKREYESLPIFNYRFR